MFRGLQQERLINTGHKLIFSSNLSTIYDLCMARTTKSLINGEFMFIQFNFLVLFGVFFNLFHICICSKKHLFKGSTSKSIV